LLFDHRSSLHIFIADHTLAAGVHHVTDDTLFHHIVRRQLHIALETPAERLDDLWQAWNLQPVDGPVLARAMCRVTEILEQILTARDEASGVARTAVAAIHA
jgi:hypothetical protein